MIQFDHFLDGFQGFFYRFSFTNTADGTLTVYPPSLLASSTTLTRIVFSLENKLSAEICVYHEK